MGGGGADPWLSTSSGMVYLISCLTVPRQFSDLPWSGGGEKRMARRLPGSFGQRKHVQPGSVIFVQRHGGVPFQPQNL